MTALPATLEATRTPLRIVEEPRLADLTQGPPWFHELPYDVAIVGLGYVGLPTALAFHAAGRSVVGLDVSARRLDNIRQGHADLLARDVRSLKTALEGEQFRLSTDLSLLEHAKTIIICVPTPVDKAMTPELSVLRGACATVVAHARAGQVVILTSTSYVGCTQALICEPLRQRGLDVGTDVFVAFSPERIDPGNSRFTAADVPRVVGGATAACTEKAVEALSGYTDNLHRVTSMGVAEMSKLVENTFRAVNVALANEFADISRALGLDISEVLDAAATKPFGFMAFRPGPGVGGHCIPCDPHYLLWQLRAERVAAPVIEQSMRAIAERPRKVVEQARAALAGAAKSLAGARILVLGAAYKADVEDVRESPAVEIMERLLKAGAEVSYFDPYVPSLAVGADGRQLLSVSDPRCVDADLVILHTAHSTMRLDWLADQALVLDTTYRLRGFSRIVGL